MSYHALGYTPPQTEQPPQTDKEPIHFCGPKGDECDWSRIAEISEKLGPIPTSEDTGVILLVAAGVLGAVGWLGYKLLVGKK